MAWLSCINVVDDVKITCATVTKNRFEHIKHAIACYLNQTYVNKEHLIVSQSNEDVNEKIIHHIDSLGRSDIRFCRANPTLTIGEVRKIATIEAWGEVVCQWDDDDHYHPKRLSTQYFDMIRKECRASYFDSHLKYYKKDNQLFWIDLSNERAERWHRILGPSAMYFKKYNGVYLEVANYYPPLSFSEDIEFAKRLFENSQVAISKDGYQYVYIYHGDNVCAQPHHYEVLEKKYVLTKSEMCKNYSHISETLSGLAESINVMGSDGLAFRN